jgi:Tol biopolymer transport system component/DNA-binding winged helix-turn-helix (wHTH) protein
LFFCFKISKAVPCYRFGPFELDTDARQLRRGTEVVPIAGKTLETLIVLLENRGRLVDKEMLFASVWQGSVVEEANLTQAVFTIRKLLDDSPRDHRYIATVAGRGYQFVAPVTVCLSNTRAADPELASGRPKSRTIWGRTLGMVLGAVIIVLTAGVSLWRQTKTDRRLEMSQLSRFTSYPGVETMPAFSPDGKQIAYVRAEHDPIGVHFWRKQVGQANIYTKLVGAATELRLTQHQGADYYPSWSPDGQYIAFYRSAPDASGLYTVSALGGPERRITREETEISGIVWLPDGHHLVVSKVAEGSRSSPLVEVSVQTGQQRPITTPSGGSMGDGWPALSPDGTRLAFLRFEDSAVIDLCLLSLAGGAPHCRSLQATWPAGVSWTSSGDSIIVSAVRTAGHRLWRYDLKGSTPVALTTGEEEAVLPTASRAGGHLAYVLSRSNGNLWQLEVNRSGRVRVTDAKPVARSTRWQADPAFSPDGEKIAFLSDRSGSQEIWISDIANQTLTQITNFGGPLTGSPSWSPDGRQIAFDSEHGAGTAIFVVSADGGTPRRITQYQGDNCVPSWSRDGKFVYFASSRSGRFEIWKVVAGVGETRASPPVQITHNGGFRAVESLDGRYLYYFKGRGEPGLRRTAIANKLSDSEEESILPSIQEWGWWALGPDVIYFLELPHSLPPQVHLKVLELSQPKTRELGILPYAVAVATPAIAASPDGRRLVYNQIDSMEADVMLIKHLQ